MRTQLSVAISVLVVGSLLSCGETVTDEHQHHHPYGDHTHEVATIEGAVTCNASMGAYPVNGPHNGGWDPNALTYTCPAHPTSSKDNSDFLGGDHYGNDIFAAKGTPLVACVDGTIGNVSNTTVGGLNVKIIDACGWHYYYAHMDVIKPGLAVGQSVKAGDYLGTVGNTGNASGTSPHLHFSVFPGTYNQGIDPFPLLQSVDADSCTGTVTPPSGPDMNIWSSTAKGDTNKDGASSGIADAFENDLFNVDIFVENKAGASNTSDAVQIGYLLETPYLDAESYSIHSDWPAKDKSTWTLNDSNSAPGNPSTTNPPNTGKLNIYAMAAGETKRIRFKVRAKEYSIGAIDHPDVRAWVWHVGGYYGEMTGFNDAVETNNAGKILNTFQQHDIYGKTHWEWNGGAAEVEGWTKGNSVADLKVNGDDALAISQSGSDPYIYSPTVSLAANTWKGFELRIRHYTGVKSGQLFWITSADSQWNGAKSMVFEANGDGAFHKVVLNPSKVATWAGTITRLRLDPTTSSSGWYDIDWMRAVKSPGNTSGDADGDMSVASADCNDNDASIKPGAAEVCDDQVDNNCVGGVDEGCEGPCTSTAEVCDGKDNDCDGVVPMDEADLDGDGMSTCEGDCDDNDKTIHPGTAELCDGLDNDCDSETDESLNLGAVCSVGEGGCGATGVLACTPTGLVGCDVDPGESTDEVCDGVDNDCDGATDEDYGLGGPCDASGPNCERNGILVCSADGATTVCAAPSASPAPEICNGVDDDCNGEVDDGFDIGQPCSVDVGDCSLVGIRKCADNGTAFCDGETRGGTPEWCDGEDNDCDGMTDEGFPLGESCTSTEPDCEGEGVWVCTPTAHQIRCDVPDDACGSDGSDGSDGSTATDSTDGADGDSLSIPATDAGSSDTEVTNVGGGSSGCSTSPTSPTSLPMPMSALLFVALLLIWRRAGVTLSDPR